MLRSWLNKFLRSISDLPRRKRRIIMVTLDFVLLAAVVWALIFARYGQFFVPERVDMILLAFAGPLLTVAVFLIFRVYHIVARYLGYFGALRLGACVALAAALWSTMLLFYGQSGVPRSVIFAYVPAGTLAIVAARLINGIGINIRRRWQGSQTSVPVLIYGVNEMAVQLAKATRRSKTRVMVGFIDDTKAMAGRSIGRHKVHRLDRLQRLVDAHGVEEIYIAVPDQSSSDRRFLLKYLEPFNLRVRIIPDLEALASGRVSLGQLRGIQGRDLLGREEVPPEPVLLSAAVKGKNVLITGAGGSIGSQLAHHVMLLEPRRVILLDHSEAALYTIDRACKAVLSEVANPPQLHSVLGSIQRPELVGEVLRENDVQTVFHAAAFKHVPIVEEHPLAGISNNVLATELFARACAVQGVERFVLISSDKAVRPKSVMGATKRCAELIVQSLAQTSENTIFTSVRFGNVLESSGSVFGLFRDQINAGGPVTVTHPDVVRYFMSLEESTNLVLQAAGMAKGGEVFVLDMGSPVKIDDMARSMIRLMGVEERTVANPDGDIEIVYVGLRPGEKLIEELILSEHGASETQHPRIFKSHEPSIDTQALRPEIDALRAAVAVRDTGLALASLERIVEGYVAPDIVHARPAASEKIVLH